jgi:hypothetical protein
MRIFNIRHYYFYVVTLFINNLFRVRLLTNSFTHYNKYGFSYRICKAIYSLIISLNFGVYMSWNNINHIYNLDGRFGAVVGIVAYYARGPRFDAQYKQLCAWTCLFASDLGVSMYNMYLQKNVIIRLIKSPLLGHRSSLWITHKENGP